MASDQVYINLEVSNIMSTCKDHLSSEWADFKKCPKLPVSNVCIYSIGGGRDNPVSVLPSVAKGMDEWELLLKDVIDAKYVLSVFSH